MRTVREGRVLMKDIVEGPSLSNWQSMREKKRLFMIMMSLSKLLNLIQLKRPEGRCIIIGVLRIGLLKMSKSSMNGC